MALKISRCEGHKGPNAIKFSGPDLPDECAKTKCFVLFIVSWFVSVIVENSKNYMHFLFMMTVHISENYLITQIKKNTCLFYSALPCFQFRGFIKYAISSGNKVNYNYYHPQD